VCRHGDDDQISPAIHGEFEPSLSVSVLGQFGLLQVGAAGGPVRRDARRVRLTSRPLSEDGRMSNGQGGGMKEGP